MLPSYFDYIFLHLKQKVRFRPELSPKFLSTLGPNPTRKARPDLQLWLGEQSYADWAKLCKSSFARFEKIFMVDVEAIYVGSSFQTWGPTSLMLAIDFNACIFGR